jgi:RNA polymerase sigma factor (sigma-70 family)
VDWIEIYECLAADLNDASGWNAIEALIRPWAQSAAADRGWSAVDDLVADTCAEVAVTFDRARGSQTFGGFVWGHFLNCRKKAWKVRQSEPLDPDSRDNPVDLPEEEYVVLRQCVADLPERERQAVELRYFEDASTREIAEALGVTETNARQLIFRGLHRLAKCYEPAGERVLASSH